MPTDVDMVEKVCNIIAVPHFPIIKGAKDHR